MNNGPQKYTVPMTLTLDAVSPEMALAQAHILSRLFTEAARKANSTWVQDTTTTTNVGQIAMLASGDPEECYDKDLLIRAFGEDRAILFMGETLSVLRD